MKSVTFVRSIINVFKLSEPQVQHLGRWSLKHDSKRCEYYIQNAYAEPGYPNIMKDEWIQERNKKDKVYNYKSVE